MIKRGQLGAFFIILGLIAGINAVSASDNRYLFYDGIFNPDASNLTKTNSDLKFLYNAKIALVNAESSAYTGFSGILTSIVNFIFNSFPSQAPSPVAEFLNVTNITPILKNGGNTDTDAISYSYLWAANGVPSSYMTGIAKIGFFAQIYNYIFTDWDYWQNYTASTRKHILGNGKLAFASAETSSNPTSVSSVMTFWFNADKTKMYYGIRLTASRSSQADTWGVVRYGNTQLCTSSCMWYNSFSSTSCYGSINVLQNNSMTVTTSVASSGSTVCTTPISGWLANSVTDIPVPATVPSFVEYGSLSGETQFGYGLSSPIPQKSVITILPEKQNTDGKPCFVVKYAPQMQSFYSRSSLANMENCNEYYNPYFPIIPPFTNYCQSVPKNMCDNLVDSRRDGVKFWFMSADDYKMQIFRSTIEPKNAVTQRTFSASCPSPKNVFANIPFTANCTLNFADNVRSYGDIGSTALFPNTDTSWNWTLRYANYAPQIPLDSSKLSIKELGWGGGKNVLFNLLLDNAGNPTNIVDLKKLIVSEAGTRQFMFNYYDVPAQYQYAASINFTVNPSEPVSFSYPFKAFFSTYLTNSSGEHFAQDGIKISVENSANCTSKYGKFGNLTWGTCEILIPASSQAMNTTASISIPYDFSWRQTPNAEWNPRHEFGSIIFNENMYVMGGADATNYFNDVWSSADGISFSQKINVTSMWSPRRGFKTVVFNNRLWVLGGYNGTLLKESWYTTDGVTWIPASTPSWTGRQMFAAETLGNAMYVMGGMTTSSTYSNDMFNSTDGVTWNAMNAAGWSGRQGMASTVFSGKIWIFGGQLSATSFSNAVRSFNGTEWANVVDYASWSPRSNFTATVFNGKMYVMGGTDGINRFNDVWSSTDGAIWKLESASPWSVRESLRSEVMGVKLMIYGGKTGGTSYNDRWETVPMITYASQNCPIYPQNVIQNDDYAMFGITKYDNAGFYERTFNNITKTWECTMPSDSCAEGIPVFENGVLVGCKNGGCPLTNRIISYQDGNATYYPPNTNILCAESNSNRCEPSIGGKTSATKITCNDKCVASVSHCVLGCSGNECKTQSEYDSEQKGKAQAPSNLMTDFLFNNMGWFGGIVISLVIGAEVSKSNPQLGMVSALAGMVLVSSMTLHGFTRIIFTSLALAALVGMGYLMFGRYGAAGRGGSQ